ncbi:hypothetical protein GY45DRAFT_1015077 [Cubamyces sp. BRFM 1775]|nr:hypothetical protein GY45DRAFT_1015077 [Cubamyces sp. BRFM 1775]
MLDDCSVIAQEYNHAVPPMHRTRVWAWSAMPCFEIESTCSPLLRSPRPGRYPNVRSKNNFDNLQIRFDRWYLLLTVPCFSFLKALVKGRADSLVV